MARPSPPYAPPNNLQQGSPGNATVAQENFDRILIDSDLTCLTTAVMTSVAIPLQSGDVVTNISFKSGATAATATIANWWFALYSSATTPALLAQTADQTSTAWAANTTKTLALATAQTITVPGLYYVGIMFKTSGTCPTLLGKTLGLAGASTGILTADKLLACTSGSALTTTAPATIATPTAVATMPYCVVS